MGLSTVGTLLVPALISRSFYRHQSITTLEQKVTGWNSGWLLGKTLYATGLYLRMSKALNDSHGSVVAWNKKIRVRVRGTRAT